MANNPFLAVFRPYIPDSVKNMRELSVFAVDRRHNFGHYFRRVVAVSRVESRFDGFGFDSGRRNFDHAVSSAFKIRDARRDDSGKQYRPNRRKRGRINRFRRRRNDAGDFDSRFRSGILARNFGCRSRRTFRNFDDDSAYAVL